MVGSCIEIQRTYIVHDDGLQGVVERSVCYLEGDGVGTCSAVLGCYLDGSRCREALGAEFYLLLRLSLGVGDGRECGSTVWERNRVVACGWSVVEGDAVDFNRLQLGVVALGYRESDGIVRCGDAVRC